MPNDSYSTRPLGTNYVESDTSNTAPIPPTVAQSVADSLHMPNSTTAAMPNYETAPTQVYQGAPGPTYTSIPTPNVTTTPFYAPPASASPMAPMAPIAPAKKSKAPLVVLLVLAALALAAFFTFTHMRSCSFGGVNSSPERVVEQAAQAALDLRFDNALDTLPPQMLDYAIGVSGFSSREELVNYLNNSVDEFNEQIGLFGLDVGTLLKVVNVNARDVSYYSADGLTGLAQTWNNRIPGFGDTFEDAARVTVDISGEIDIFGQKISLSDYIDNATQDITTVKINGQWYILEADLGELSEITNML